MTPELSTAGDPCGATSPEAETALRRVLERDPDNRNALRRLGLLAMQAGRGEAAVDYLQRAVALGESGKGDSPIFVGTKMGTVPLEFDAVLQNDLGVALAGLKRLDEALACFQRAAQLDPRQADAPYNCGNALRMLDRLDEAVGQYRAALAASPSAPEIHYNLANTLRDLGRLKEAVAAYREALRLRPHYSKAANNLANVLREQGKLEEAAEVCRAALRLRPDYAEGHHNLGVVLSAVAAARKGEGEKGGKGAGRGGCAFSRGVAAQAGPGGRGNSLGKLLTEQGRLDEALPILQSAQNLGQNTVESQLRLAEKLRQAGRYDEAVACIQAVIEAHADLAAAHNNLGLVWASKQDFQRAAACYREAVRIKPDFAEAQNNLAIALLNTGDGPGGQAAINAALRIKPDFAVAHLNRAVAWLQQGDFERGWHEFEWRRLCEPYRVAPLPAPLWDGTPGADRCILLHAEQGLGDTLQLIRYAPLVKERCATVILQCQKAVLPLLKRCPGVDRLLVRGDALPQYHVQAPLMSLPLILGTTLSTIPAAVPYVFADEELTRAWRERLATHLLDRKGTGTFFGCHPRTNGDGPMSRKTSQSPMKVGISWQGNPKYAADRLRSIPLEHFRPLGRIEGITLFSLQKGVGSEQLAALAPEFPAVDFGPDFDTAAGAFMDTAAVMRNLDLVVTSDTAVAHLAGALGVPVWVALGSSADWRWLEEREDCPWYPTMRLFRQQRPGDWAEVFQAIAAELLRVRDGDISGLAAPRRAPAPMLHAAVSAGDLLDRIGILELKRAKITEPAAGRNIARAGGAAGHPRSQPAA